MSLHLILKKIHFQTIVRPTMTGKIVSVILFVLIFACASPAQVFAQLQVSSDGHYLQFRGKKVLLIGDSVTQGWFETGTNFDYQGYVDALTDRGINVLMIWSFIGTSGNTQTKDGRIGYDAPEVWPWAKSGSNFNLTQLNQAYFDRLAALVNYASSKDVVVLITVHDGWTKDRFGGHPFNSSLGGPLSSKSQYVDLNISANKTAQEQFAQKIITTLEPYDNVIYEMFNEGEWYNQTQRNSHEQHFLNFFNSRTDKLLMTNSDHIAQDDPTHDAKVDIISFHPSTWSGRFNQFAGAFKLSPTKVYFLSEPVPGWNGTNLSIDTIRNSIWTTAMGGAGWVNQNDTSFSWDPNTNMASKISVRNQAYDIAGYAAKFFNEYIDLDGMTPDGNLCSTNVCLANEGQEYVVYSESGSSFTVDLSSVSGTLTARFYNPRTGTFQSSFTVNGGSSSQSFTKPNSNDWVLHLKSGSGSTPSPSPSLPPSPSPTPLPTPTATPVACQNTDINQDGIVDLSDYSALVAEFFSTNPSNPRTDINQDGIVDLSDYSLLVSDFFETTNCG